MGFWTEIGKKGAAALFGWGVEAVVPTGGILSSFLGGVLEVLLSSLEEEIKKRLDERIDARAAVRNRVEGKPRYRQPGAARLNAGGARELPHEAALGQIDNQNPRPRFPFQLCRIPNLRERHAHRSSGRSDL